MPKIIFSHINHTITTQFLKFFLLATLFYLHFRPKLYNFLAGTDTNTFPSFFLASQTDPSCTCIRFEQGGVQCCSIL